MKSDRNIVYSFIQQAIDDARRHLEAARWQICTAAEVDDPIDRCLRARDALLEAEQEIAVSSSIVTTKKKNIFYREIEDLHRELWCVTKDISKKTRTCYDQHRQTRVLRMHFLAYSFDPRNDAEAVGG